MKFNGVMIGTEDVGKMADFYTKVLGEPTWNMGGFYGWATDGANLMLGAHSEVKGESVNPQRMLMQFEASDVKAEFERIKECGASVVAEPYQPDSENSPNVWLATVADVDGNYIQLATPWEG